MLTHDGGAFTPRAPRRHPRCGEPAADASRHARAAPRRRATGSEPHARARRSSSSRIGKRRVHRLAEPAPQRPDYCVLAVCSGCIPSSSSCPRLKCHLGSVYSAGGASVLMPHLAASASVPMDTPIYRLRAHPVLRRVARPQGQPLEVEHLLDAILGRRRPRRTGCRLCSIRAGAVVAPGFGREHDDAIGHAASLVLAQRLPPSRAGYIRGSDQGDPG